MAWQRNQSARLHQPRLVPTNPLLMNSSCPPKRLWQADDPLDADFIVSTLALSW
jgi:hypothetical protein